MIFRKNKTIFFLFGMSKNSQSFCVFAVALFSAYIHRPVIVCAKDEKAGKDFMCHWKGTWAALPLKDFCYSIWEILHSAVLWNVTNTIETMTAGIGSLTEWNVTPV